MQPPPLRSTLFPYTTLFRSCTSSSPTTAAWSTEARSLPAPARPRSSTRSTSSARSEEHTSELQSPYDIVCRLLLEKKTQPKLDTETGGNRILRPRLQLYISS